MIFKNISEDIPVRDEDFNTIYSKKLQEKAPFHFTPVAVAKRVAQYLVDKSDTRVLDIGSGVGKFCMIGSVCTDGYFVGVEQRPTLFSVANRLVKKYKLSHLEFINANITSIEFTQYDAFYCFNPFFENLRPDEKIDNSVELNRDFFHTYAIYVRQQLEKMPKNTKSATYYSFLEEVPDSFQIQDMEMDGKLKLWRKIS
jgi:Methyltransferase domain